MNWECPFDTDIEEDQDPEGTICRDFLREHISAVFSFEKACEWAAERPQDLANLLFD